MLVWTSGRCEPRMHGGFATGKEPYMLSKSALLPSCPAPRQTPSDIIREHLARLAVEGEMRAERRRLEQTEQCLSSSSPAMRIRVWEKLHGLCLPRNATHPVLEVIALATHLSLADIRQEQHTRMVTHRC